MAQMALNQALQSRARAATVTSSTEMRLAAWDSSVALRAMKWQPPRIPKIPRKDVAAKQQMCQSLTEKLAAARTARRADRLYAKRERDMAKCQEENTKYSGNTAWRISQLAIKWRRAALARTKAETERSQRTLNPAASQDKLRRPDERVADDRAWQKFRRTEQDWRPPAAKPERPRRVQRRSRKKQLNSRRHARNQERKKRSPMLALTDKEPEPEKAQPMPASKRRKRGSHHGKKTQVQAKQVGRQ